MKSVAVVGNGKLIPEFVTDIKAHDLIIGVDRAAYWLLEQGIVPDMAIGDFDSVNQAEFDKIKRQIKTVKSFPPEKDFTDMELGLQEAKKFNPELITLFGGVGSRLDHSLGNIFLLDHFHDTFSILQLRDENNLCQIVRQTAIVEKSAQYKYVSLLSLTDQSTVTLKGFVYDIANYTIKRGQTIGISNEIKKGKGEVTVHQGRVLVIQSRD